MKYSTVLFALVAGVMALPQEGSSVTSAPASAASADLRPQESCAAACDPTDVTCRAACMGVARPNTSQILETNECARKCDQGDGSKSQTEEYGKCLLACYASYFPSTQTAGNLVNQPANTAASNAASATNGSPSGSNAPTGTNAQATGTDATGTAAGSSETGAANINSVKFAGAGIAGLAMAIFAL